MSKSSLNPRPGEWELADLCLYNDLNHVVLIEQWWLVKSGGRKARSQLFFFFSLKEKLHYALVIGNESV